MLVTNFDILKVLKFPKNHQTRFSLKSPILRSKSTLSPLGPQTGLTFKTDICAQLQISQQKEHNLDFLFLNMAETNVGKCTSSVCFPFIFQLFCRLLSFWNIFKSEVEQVVSLRRRGSRGGCRGGQRPFTNHGAGPLSAFPNIASPPHLRESHKIKNIIPHSFIPKRGFIELKIAFNRTTGRSVNFQI